MCAYIVFLFVLYVFSIQDLHVYMATLSAACLYSADPAAAKPMILRIYTSTWNERETQQLKKIPCLMIPCTLMVPLTKIHLKQHLC